MYGKTNFKMAISAIKPDTSGFRNRKMQLQKQPEQIESTANLGDLIVRWIRCGNQLMAKMTKKIESLRFFSNIFRYLSKFRLPFNYSP